MRLLKETIKLFWLSFACLTITALTFLWMPFIQGKRAGLVITGIVFWGTLIAGCVLIYLANKKRIQAVYKLNIRFKYASPKIGLFKFFSNIPAIIADSALASSLILALIVALSKLKETYMPYFILFLLLFSLSSHCLFNGKVYRFINVKQFRGDEDHG